MNKEMPGKHKGIPHAEEIVELYEAVGIRPMKADIIHIQRLFENAGAENPEQLDKAEELLETIQRFRGMSMRAVDTVSMHVARMLQMLLASQHSLSYTFNRFDFDTSVYVIEDHDTPEGMSSLGDIPTPVKKKLIPRLAGLLERIERACFDILSHTVHVKALGNDFSSLSSPLNVEYRRKIWRAYEEKQEIWAQVVKYLDILDAFLMSLYEYHDHQNEDFGAIVERYRAMLREIISGQKLPAIHQIYENIGHIRELLEEDFGGMDTHQIYSGAVYFFDFDDLQEEYPKALGSWKEHVYASQ